MTSDTDTETKTETETRTDVAVVGGGVAGRSAAIFTARHGLDTTVLDAGESILARNAHLENYPGFPAGVDARLLLELMRDQGERAGAVFRDATVTRVERADDGFALQTADGGRWRASFVVAATKNETDYLDGLAGLELLDRGKTFVATTAGGRTGVDGLYAAGRMARKPHQTIVCAGHGAEVGLAVLEDSGRPFYHDWVAPEGRC